MKPQSSGLAFVKRGDLALLTVFFALIAAGILIRPRAPAGKSITISVNNETVHTLSLMSTHTITVQGATGPVIIRVDSGEAWIESSNCPHLYCVREGRIQRQGEMVVCLPNRVVLSVGGGQEALLDGITE